ncbi:DUF5681 domain-containing protein [Methylosinus sp. KRF6]|uniref:DUF5681 domain-containing protein n=1 Tax=Methylosinus sp. KRF6 TaxID=2846853 RepID=UPI001C0DC941|nr:DUF5681 domain-containing protein [Methylosinus sp. KRF6]MBU3888571.1 hypothetical protein [Methylosinus sp. KRF6]
MSSKSERDDGATPESDDADVESAAPKVGYRRPPLHTRFKPGQSGNPRGRPKGAKNIDMLCRSLLSRKVTIQENGGRRKVTAVEAIVLATIQRAVRGDNRAAKIMLDLQHRLPTLEDAETGAVSSAEDQAIIAEFLATLQEARQLEPESEDRK